MYRVLTPSRETIPTENFSTSMPCYLRQIFSGHKANRNVTMYKVISRLNAIRVKVYEGQLFLGKLTPQRRQSIHPCSLDGVIGDALLFPHKEDMDEAVLFKGLWLIYHKVGTPFENLLDICSLGGERKQSITGIDGYFDKVALEEEPRFYLVDEQCVISYDLSTHEYQDLGPFPLKDPFFYKGSHRGLHFFSCEGKSQLVAMRDKDGQGLEEVYRLDFSESGRGYSLWRNGVVPGEIDFINFYGPDLWVTTQEHLHRIDVATGNVLERQDETLPKMFIKGSIGYSLYNSYYTVFDFEAGRMISDERRDRFAYEGKEYSSEYRSLLLHEGIFYVSVRVSGIFFLAAFDVQTEEFVWYDLWGGWDIDSVHIVGDRMIAHSHDEVRIYQRVGRLTRLAKKLRGALLHLISPLTSDR